MASTMTRARVGNLGKNVKQGKPGNHRKVPPDLKKALPALRSTSLLAKVNFQTTLRSKQFLAS
jgi:hypothetical protein